MTVAVASGLSAGTASAGLWTDFTDAVTGHYEDAKGRIFGENMTVPGPLLAEGTFDETAVGQDAAHWAKGTVQIIQGLVVILVKPLYN